MENIHGSVTWYQQKIGSYDKQLWEQSVEQKVLKGIKQAPRRSVKPRTEFIDVDLIRGSTFTKAKPQVPWTYITLKTFSRVLLFPFHYKWWIQQTSLSFWLLLLSLYVMQIFTVIVFFNNVGDELFRDELSLSEVVIPGVLMVLLGLIHSQTVLAHLKPPIRDTKRDTWRRKRSLSQNRTVSTSSDIGASPSTQQAAPPDPNPTQVKPGTKGQGSRLPRSKDRKIRLKQNAQKKGARKENPNEKGLEDSESAYHTYEASDSVADRTSSVEHDSNSSDKRKSNSSGSDGVRVDRFTSPGLHNKKEALEEIAPDWDGCRKARESQESDFPQDSNSEDDKCKDGDDYLEKSKRNSQSISSENEGDEMEDVKKVVPEGVGTGMVVTNTDKEQSVRKVNRSDLNCKPGDTTTEVSRLLLSTADDSSSTVNSNNQETFHPDGENDKIENMNGTSGADGGDKTSQLNGGSVLGLPLDTKIGFEGKSVNSARTDNNKVGCTDLGENSSHLTSRNSHVPYNNQSISGAMEASDSSFLDVSMVETTGHANNGAVTSDSLSSQKSSLDPTQSSSVDPTRQSLSLPGLTSNLKSPSATSAGQRPRRATHSHNSVHFTNDPVNLREITPKSSREGTPTHTQSDGILQTKHARAAAQKINKIDTETDSETEIKVTKSLPNVRRRKLPGQETADLSGTTLRHRRNVNAAGAMPESKTNSTGVSSSDGETEGQSSEYSRGARKNMASSEEWGDHLQSDVDTSSESSSCGSEPEISGHEEPEVETEDDAHSINANQGLTSSHMHVINLLHPSTSTSVSHTPPDKVTCIIWERNDCKKVELTAMDIGWAIIETVDKIPESSDYILIGIFFSILIGATPLMFQAFHAKDLPSMLSWDIFPAAWELACNNSWRENLIHANAILQRLCLSAIYFFMLSVADRTFKQRLLYAKHFCYLTSSRRARKFDMPHFRLNKVRNIRIWLSLRSYLKKRGPQRSVDMIVSSAFLMTLSMLILMCLQLLRDAEIYLNYLVNWELLVWCMALGIYLLRFMTLGLRINKKYRNLSVLITEQINLYLQMEQKPHKKEELMVANNVLKLAESLIKELESPFKISGISANPLILNITRVVVLSAFSAVLTELVGFKLKLYKIKLRA